MKQSPKKFSRRSILKGSLSSAVGLAVRAAVTGLPASFLMTGTVHAATGNEKFLVLSGSPAGEAMNVNGPGTYEGGVSSLIAHPQYDVVGSDVSMLINGQEYNASDLENSADILLGDQTVRAARCYTALYDEFLQGLTWFNHRTMTNAHPEYRSVTRLHGALLGEDGRGNEELPSAIAQETWSGLGTTLKTPFILNGSYSSNGAPLNVYQPTQVKSLINNSAGGVEHFDTIYDYMIDEIYHKVKEQGTPSQKRFLDQHALSKQQAGQLGEELGSLLDDIIDNGSESELKAALAIIKIKLSPVVVVRHRFSGDNHNDSTLAVETLQTLDMVRSLNAYWDRAKEYNVQDILTYATLGVFGRTNRLNNSGGRNHLGQFTSGIIHGSHLNGGLVGGLEADSKDRVRATGINVTTGGSGDDIAGDDTLAAFMKTVMTACGVSEERCDARIPAGQIVRSLFS